MENFKKRWEIQHNWQLIFPFLGMTGVIYSAYRITVIFIQKTLWIPIITLVLSVLLLKFFLWTFKKLENKWILQYKWEMIRVFIVFAITGSTAAYIGKPILEILKITKENLNPFIYWLLFIIIGLIFYQILLVSFGWLFGQFKFFWEFEKKMLKRMGLGRFLKK